MTTDPKVVELVVNKTVESAQPIDFAIEMRAQVKYCDSEVTLIKTDVKVFGKIAGASHFIVETPKE